MPEILGGCLCGAVRYEAQAEPGMIAVCHCATCQKNTGSAFSLNLGMPQDAVAIEGDALAIYEDRAGASGKPFYRSFCSRCGSPISGKGDAYEGLIFIKAGTLDDPSWVKPNAHIWCSEKQPWVTIEEGVPQIERRPTDREESGIALGRCRSKGYRRAKGVILGRIAIAFVLLGSALLGTVPAVARSGEVRVVEPWSRAMPPVSPNGAAYFTLVNDGAVPDRLVSASSPVAARVELHGHTMENGIMKMRPVGPVPVEPGRRVTLEPGGLHLMLMGLKRPLVEGESFPVELEFENAGALEIVVPVMPPGATGGRRSASMSHGSHGKSMD